MQLITTNRRDTGAEIVPYNPTAPHVKAALQTMGGEVEFFRPFVPANLHYVCSHQENAMRLGKTRQVSLVMAAYGTAPMLRCIREHLIYAKMLNLYDWTDADIEQIAVGLLRTEEARLLDLISLLGFFKDIVDGRVTLYSGNYSAVMQAFQTYFGKAKARENDLRGKIAKEREEEREYLTGDELRQFLEDNKILPR